MTTMSLLARYIPSRRTARSARARPAHRPARSHASPSTRGPQRPSPVRRRTTSRDAERTAATAVGIPDRRAGRHDDPRDDWRTSSRVAPSAFNASGLWAPSRITSGWCDTTSTRPSRRTRARLSRTRSTERPVEERLDRGDGDRRRCGLHGPMQGRKDPSRAIVHPAMSTRRPPTAGPTGEHLADVPPPATHRRGTPRAAPASSDPAPPGVGLDDPGLRPRRPAPSRGEVRGHRRRRGHDRHLGTDHVGRVKAGPADRPRRQRRRPAPRRTSAAARRSPAARTRRAAPTERLDRGSRRAPPTASGRRSAPVTTEAFVDPLQMGLVALPTLRP